MNWKKWVKNIGIGLLILTIGGAVFLYFGMNSSMRQFYGANTPVVDHTQFELSTGRVAIQNVNILSPDAEQFIAGQTVIIENGKIQSIDSSSNISTQTKIIDGSEKYLIPGLVDSHVHLFYSPNDLLLYIANGVTTIREMMGNKERLGWKKEIENGRIGPKMWVASPPLGTADNMEKRMISWTRQAKNVNTASQAEKAIEDFIDKGYDGVKIYSHLNKESYLAATKKANDLDFPIVGHIPWETELEDVWDNGQSEVAHFEELMNALRRKFDESKEEDDDLLEYIIQESEQLAEQLIQRDIAVTSTLSLVDGVYNQKFDLEKVLKGVELNYANVGLVEGVKFGDSGFGWLPGTNLYRLPSGLTEEQIEGQKQFWSTYVNACKTLAVELTKRGVNILAGTDANIPCTVPGFSLHDEFNSLTQFGMSNAQVLRSATSAPSKWLGHNTGKITVGLDADLVLLDKDPLSNIANTRAINTVFSNGKVYDRQLLDQMLEAVKGANDSVRKIDINQYSK